MYKNITHSVSNDMQERRDAKTESLMRSLNKEKTLYIVDTISLNNPVIVYYQKRYYVMDSITACKYNFNHLKMNWYLEDPNVYFVHRNGIILSYLYLEFIFGRVSQTNTVFNEAFFEDSIQKGKILPQKWVKYVESNKLCIIRTKGKARFVLCLISSLYEGLSDIKAFNSNSNLYFKMVYSLDYTQEDNIVYY